MQMAAPCTSLTGSEVDPFVASVRNATAIAVDTAGGKVYWAERTGSRSSRIRRANLNGRNVELVREIDGADPRGIAIDPSKGKSVCDERSSATLVATYSGRTLMGLSTIGISSSILQSCTEFAARYRCGC